ncbi:unnamed protein product [Penicillium olsonii]|nr:unnamed protein product [Penicillium olsonii]CAG7931082.1 unnamed protein product [Penicillium olsonii]
MRLTFAQSLMRTWAPRCQRTGPVRRMSSTTIRRSRLRARLEIPPPFPVTKSCPESSCNCPPTPDMPRGMPIDHEQALNGTMAAYTEQLLVCTGQQDWASRIENDGENQGWGNLVRGLKKLLGRGGPYLDASSSITPATSSSTTASAFLFPSFKYIPSIPVDNHAHQTDLTTFVRAYLLPKRLHDMHASLPVAKQVDMTRFPDLQGHFPDAVDINYSPTILICGHGGRDMRCGTMAPALESEFQRVLQARGFTSANSEGTTVDAPNHAHIGRISHIGGHKYAGNVIVYLPPKMTIGGGTEPHPLAGKGIWYGRIEPKHVEGLVEETVLGGKVVTDHFRGGIDRSGDILRM